MLDRIRGFVKQLELPQEEQEDVVYRIIDDNRNAIEVTATQYARWRVQHDVARRAVVGQDTVGSVMVRTTFSIMPESRGYKPFGTAGFLLPDYDPIAQYSQRYDTWLQADLGHRETVRLITRELEETPDWSSEADNRAEETEVVLYSVSTGLPALFVVEPNPDSGTIIRTPWLLPDGSHIEVLIKGEGEGYLLTGPSTALNPVGDSTAQRVMDWCETLSVSYADGVLAVGVGDALQLSHAIASLTQAIVGASLLTHQAK